MSAGAIRRSWRPAARIVLWQFEHGAVGPSARQITTLSGLSLPRAVQAEAANRVIGLPWAASRLAASSTRGSLTLPHIRLASNSSALRSEDEDKDESLELANKNSDKGDLVRSNYWGITPKENLREDGTPWPWNCFRPAQTYTPDITIDLLKHHKPENWEDRLAFWSVKALRVPTDLFFRKRYGCRAMMLETVAAVPGMVGGLLLHLRSLRRFEHSGGWIKALLEEAENERMHLMTFMEVAKPNWYERALVVATQGVFFNAYFLFYLLAPRVAHRFTGYLEEEAIYSYTRFLEEIEKGNIENVPAPAIAIDYWRLPKDATLKDVVTVVRADEAHHRDVNHYASDIRKEGKQLHEAPAPVDYH
ncbi:ubiquinol oxidase [Marchantia polymorpha subsp. ruderalis]|uniref:Ubiquinol oxidase n=2 Tax=Marchantia polymorpha TaxID=3197 RepID=A0A176VLI5_MARPO|nr:hypothetical protein AXG93_2550s1220 [Marchantia polymorpha subsp. ruderalis]PTQ46991.1 hypothetical protein MARPO_0009s0095 [Marchantia polymorpha]BBN17386.1 hypothetical protein Mp_7g14100 [Marchantia polymorpha subsp. ruderalis]|eukprot:PTQ46991.1 hypothetical protein MARPO_0009s0095 [Marchantia polymorpha]